MEPTIQAKRDFFEERLYRSFNTDSILRTLGIVRMEFLIIQKNAKFTSDWADSKLFDLEQRVTELITTLNRDLVTVFATPNLLSVQSVDDYKSCGWHFESIYDDLLAVAEARADFEKALVDELGTHHAGYLKVSLDNLCEKISKIIAEMLMSISHCLALCEIQRDYESERDEEKKSNCRNGKEVK